MPFLKLYKKKTNEQKSYQYYECYYIDYSNSHLYIDKLKDLLGLDEIIYSLNKKELANMIEYGPKINMMTPWCSNALAILGKINNINNINRIEKSIIIPKKYFKIEHIDPMTQDIYDKPLESFDTSTNDNTHNNVNINTCENKYDNIYEIDINDMKSENIKLNLGFDEQDIKFYQNLFTKLNRKPTNIELHDLSESNSEHSRHWFFNGILEDECNNSKKTNKTLFQMVKETQNNTNDKNVIAFSDNASAIKGFEVNTIIPNIKTYDYKQTKNIYHITFTAETHNFPTGIAPFQGATTGTGGRIRDTHAIGRGGHVIAGTAGYCVGDIFNGSYCKKNLRTLIKASDGASDYGNKFGEPLILGFCRSFGISDKYDKRIEWVKPIMFSGGIGQMNYSHVKKCIPKENMLVVKIGGPAYNIGIGGSSASSRCHDINNKEEDLSAVQRGDPEMENKLNKLIKSCIELENNPIKSIHDQGAGGTCNVTKEIVYPTGAIINLDNITLGDKTMNSLQKWISEYQEQDTILINDNDLDLIKYIGKRENIGIDVIGKIVSTGNIQVYSNDKLIVNLPLEDVVGNNIGQNVYCMRKYKPQIERFENEIGDFSIIDILKNILQIPDVCSKRFLTNKVDRSVTGLIAQQQCVGDRHTPLSNFAIIAQSHYNLTGAVTSIGEKPMIGLYDVEAMARMAIGEMLTNMVFAKITSFEDIRCSGNWMWAIQMFGEKKALYMCCKAMCNMMNELKIALDGGKDSLSMSFKNNERYIDAPRQLVISGYVTTDDITMKATPDFKYANTSILYIDLSNGNKRLGGSAYERIFKTNCGDVPDVNNIALLKDTFNKIQKLLSENKILAGHDISDGGFITSLCEMSFSGEIGFLVDVSGLSKLHYNNNLYNILFNEELGLLMEVKNDDVDYITNLLGNSICHKIGKTVNENKCKIKFNNMTILDCSITYLRSFWEKTSFELECKQTKRNCAVLEYESLMKIKKIKYLTNYKLTNYEINKLIEKPKVAIIRDEGSNGEREMASAFYMAGFDVYDICMNDFILNENLTLDKFRGIAFVGGFTYSDVFGAGVGWYNVIKNNERINNEFIKFKNRSDTFSIGVCNGCQLMSLLDWIPSFKMKRNVSNRFESRFSTIKIKKSNSIMLKNLEDSVLGVWVAHGEGRFSIDANTNTNDDTNDDINDDINIKDDKFDLDIIHYVNERGNCTEDYPANPNGSPRGIAGVCSKDGRHLALMPHPERSFLNWQCPVYLDKLPKIGNDGNDSNNFTPWFGMFRNAYEWCLKN